MNKDWVQAKEAEYTVKAQNYKADIIAKINSSGLLTDKDKQILKRMLDKEHGKLYGSYETSAMHKIMKNHTKQNDRDFTDFMDVYQFISSLNINAYNNAFRLASGGLNRYLDSEPMEFDGDIIITDPCYIIRAPHHGTIPLTDDDWAACEYGENMGALGIHHYMTRDTLYGDWSCTVYNTDTKETLGNFCADAGLVSVFLLDEVLKYNPDFNYHKEREWTTTLIPDFKGIIQFVVKYNKDDYNVYVVGHGINKKTGESVNFHSIQTGL